jgi:hypothetical protein
MTSDAKNPTDPTGEAAEAAEQNAPLPDGGPRDGTEAHENESWPEDKPESSTSQA